MIRSSPEINELATALALAQGEIAAAPKDNINPHFKSRYADLAACWGAARPALSKHGLAVVQTIVSDMDHGRVGVFTRLVHKSGQWFEGDVWCQPRAMGPQDIGAAGTYLKRYGFCALVGVVADEDDDGNKASGREEKGRLQEKKEQRMADAAATRAERSEKAGTFTGSEQQEKIVAAILEKKSVPREFWDEIRSRLMGKKSTDLDAVIEAVRQGAVDAQADIDRTF